MIGAGGGTTVAIPGGAAATGLLVGADATGLEEMSGPLGALDATAGLVSTGGGLLSATGCLRSQPWKSMTRRLVTLTPRTQATVILRRERRRLCWASSDPFGTNGFGLFICLAQCVLVSRCIYF